MISKSAPGLTVDAVADYLREGIRQGRYMQGQRLVASELVQQLGVSLNVVREALSALDGAGLVDVQPNRGASVRTLTRTDIVELYQVREALEGQAAALAAANIEASGKKTLLRSACQAGSRAARAHDAAAYRLANHEFHNAIYELSGNQRLTQLSREMAIPIFSVQLHLLLGEAERRDSDNDHRALSEAILAGDRERAEKLMREHVRSSCIALLRFVE